MAVPGFQEWFLPLLHELADDKEHAIAPLSQTLADKLNLSDEDKAERLPSQKSKRSPD